MANPNMNQTTQDWHALLDPHRLLVHSDIGLPPDAKRPTLCGRLLVTPEVENTAIGGIICIDGAFYAMTSGAAIIHVQRSYKMQFSSQQNLDWGLCQIFPSLAFPNMHNTYQLLDYKTGTDVGNFDGPVKVLTRAEEYNQWGHFDSQFDKTENGVEWHAFVLQLPEKIKIPTAAWVIKNNLLCGYVVQTTYVVGTGRVCYMIPIWDIFREIEAQTGKKIVFGQELHDMMERL